MNKDDLEKEELIEMMRMHLQNMHSISPLTGKIWAILILEGKDYGLTFEYLVERLHASKSSISTSLNTLIKTDKIYFSTITGDRKKYFKSHPFSERFVRHLKSMDFEKKMLEKIITYKIKTEKADENNCALENIKAYKEHLNEMEKITKKLLTDLKKIEEKNLNNKY